MDLLAWFRQLSRYNRIANERIYEACSGLSVTELRETRRVSFGSIHGLLNHILLGDRIWMARFEGCGESTPPLDTILYDDFPDLHAARSREDARIESFFASLTTSQFSTPIRYVNSKGKHCSDEMPMAVGHMFNHQTHHRGQVHAMLAQTAVPSPSLDLHRIVNP